MAPAKKGFDPIDHMMNLKGKDYLPVAARIIWFRTDYPEGIVDVELVDHSPEHAIFRSTVTAIKDGEVKGRATDYGSETRKDFNDFIEKASTKATGRALAALGYGTLMAPELDEGSRVVDTPQQRAPQAAQAPRNAPKQPNPTNTPLPAKIDPQAVMNRLHGIANKRGMTHDDIRKLAIARAAKDGLTITSTKECPPILLAELANGINSNAQPFLNWLKREKASQSAPDAPKNDASSEQEESPEPPADDGYEPSQTVIEIDPEFEADYRAKADQYTR